MYGSAFRRMGKHVTRTPRAVAQFVAVRSSIGSAPSAKATRVTASQHTYIPEKSAPSGYSRTHRTHSEVRIHNRVIVVSLERLRDPNKRKNGAQTHLP